MIHHSGILEVKIKNVLLLLVQSPLGWSLAVPSSVTAAVPLIGNRPSRCYEVANQLLSTRTFLCF